MVGTLHTVAYAGIGVWYHFHSLEVPSCLRGMNCTQSQGPGTTLVLRRWIRGVALRDKMYEYLQSLSFPTGTIPSEAELEVTGLLWSYRARSALRYHLIRDS